MGVLGLSMCFRSVHGSVQAKAHGRTCLEAARSRIVFRAHTETLGSLFSWQTKQDSPSSYSWTMHTTASVRCAVQILETAWKIDVKDSTYKDTIIGEVIWITEFINLILRLVHHQEFLMSDWVRRRWSGRWLIPRSLPRGRYSVKSWPCFPSSRLRNKTTFIAIQDEPRSNEIYYPLPPCLTSYDFPYLISTLFQSKLDNTSLAPGGDYLFWSAVYHETQRSEGKSCFISMVRSAWSVTDIIWA